MAAMPDYYLRQYETTALVDVVTLLGVFARQRMRGEAFPEPALRAVTALSKTAGQYLDSALRRPDDVTACHKAALAFLETCIGERTGI